MFLLPLLAGILLVLQGPDSLVLGTRNIEAEEYWNYMKYLDELNKLKTLLNADKTRQENRDLRVSNNGGINFAAVDNSFEDIPSEKEINEINAGVEEPKRAGTGASTTEKTEPTTTDKDIQHVHANPVPPEKLTAQQSEHIDVIPKKDFIFVAVVSACSVAGLVGLIMAGVCWYKLHRRVKAASDVEYPAYGVTGPTKERLPSPGDRKLAQSAQMYHYQHQKQQMIAMEKANGEMKHDASEDESEEENEEGDYTVYECPGLAPTGEMEVRNPLFTEDAQTPVNGQPTAVNGLQDDHEQE
ncbi:neural proliferation differentiation and control protein 1-like [Ruditapes philippinarum]|uniref:neural proliferation differentiation and control protein 1-like n=1 Tax=Ruditapes philippinarum TaxID=129788 RepID=UPI00295C20F9|nr:neural proliferation differentiation and control protein 1-like [Ruditapes philippinarum]